MPRPPINLYMPVTNDRFELPVGPAMNISEISAFLGRSKQSIWDEARWQHCDKVTFRRGNGKNYKIISFAPGEDFYDG